MSKVQDAAIECMDVLSKAGATSVLVFADDAGGCSTKTDYQGMLDYLERCQERIRVTQREILKDKAESAAKEHSDDSVDTLLSDCATRLKKAGFDEIAIYVDDQSLVMSRIEQTKNFMGTVISHAQKILQRDSHE